MALKVYLDNNISHADSACLPKSSYRIWCAFEHITDEQVSRAGDRAMMFVPWIYMNLSMLHQVPNSSVSKILRWAQNF
jgi:hypothetical protein